MPSVPVWRERSVGNTFNEEALFADAEELPIWDNMGGSRVPRGGPRQDSDPLFSIQGGGLLCERKSYRVPSGLSKFGVSADGLSINKCADVPKTLSDFCNFGVLPNVCLGRATLLRTEPLAHCAHLPICVIGRAVSPNHIVGAADFLIDGQLRGDALTGVHL